MTATKTLTGRPLIGQTWVAFGPAGAVGSIHRIDDGFTFKLVRDDDFRASYPSLEVAKSALHASLLPGAEWPEFREH
ncbi:MAG: methyltransferase [Lacisediminihabitans sp.]